ncbi:hypothetical protein Pcinc_014269 [Petrolisthes cinctipes]|uniref:Dynein heavy chain hydrolytic ATP-binding dynein motor region domain-containing protein n=1 Tax=Petrolisthes cinctipes TaxID=88211 RepID=A0AAE1G0N3_PETCI|nr:hypothetical protein Pcinc_014269 [Petrolisthes cinctipes]
MRRCRPNKLTVKTTPPRWLRQDWSGVTCRYDTRRNRAVERRGQSVVRYAGRRELPDSLKVLFRTVAMMVPDYVLIAKISLFSMGFVQADSLACKIIDTYRLCSEQLSLQHHYDYGMRAVKAVLLAANNLRLLLPNLPESQIILKAIQDVNLPKFVAQDVELFEGIVKDLFPSESSSIQPDSVLEVAIRKTLAENNLQEVPWFRNKMLQLYNMVLVRHGVMVVGEPLSGKTQIYQTLAAALQQKGRQRRLGMFKAITKGVSSVPLCCFWEW